MSFDRLARARALRRRRRLAATRSVARARSAAAPAFSCAARARLGHTGAMGPLPRTYSPEVVLPIAIARPQEAAAYRSALAGSFDRWAQQRWRFLAPRLVPGVLALLGMVGVLASMDLMASRCRLEPRASPTTVYLVGDSVAHQ
jgi:hypothetical protein